MYVPPEPLRSLVEAMSRDVTVNVRPVIYDRYRRLWVHYVLVRSGWGSLEMVTASAAGLLSMAVIGDLLLGSAILIDAFIKLGAPTRVILARSGSARLLIANWCMQEVFEELQKHLREYGVFVERVLSIRELERTAELFLKALKADLL